MRKYWKLILAAIAFVVFMVVVSVIYKNLSTEYKPQQNLVTQKGQETMDNPVSQSSAGEDSLAGTIRDEGQGSEESVGNAEQDSTASQNNSTETDASENLAPNFTVENAEGEEVSLHDFFGKPIVLNFWASWCGPCKMELPDFQDAFEKYEGEIEFVMVNMTDGMQETKEIAMEFMEGEGYTLPVYYDTAQDAAYTYTVYSLPTTFFIGADGEAVAYAQGMIDAQTLEKGISMIYP